jgi:hypothetical protein
MWMASKPRLVVLAIISCGVQFVAAQAQKSVQIAVEDRIQRVTSGLVGSIVLHGQEHATYTLADRMKVLRVAGVGIAVIRKERSNGHVDWGPRTRPCTREY